MRNLFFALSSLLATAAVPLAAQNSLDPVEARVLPGWVLSDGTRIAALDLRLAPGWKTYWRAPGDAGIPPIFDWSGSGNLANVSISWPAPMVFDQNGMRSYGYKDRLVLPIKITPRTKGEDVDLRVDVDMGVCSDVCIPYQLSLQLVLDESSKKPTPEIAGALAQQPYSAQEAGVTGSTCRIEPIADGLRLEARITMPSAGKNEVLVIEPGLPEVWVSESKTQRRGGEIVATSDMIHVSGGVFALDRSAIRLTVLSNGYAVEVQGCSAG